MHLILVCLLGLAVGISDVDSQRISLLDTNGKIFCFISFLTMFTHSSCQWFLVESTYLIWHPWDQCTDDHRKWQVTETTLEKKKLFRHRLASSFHVYIALLSKVRQSFKQEIKQFIMLLNKVFIISCNIKLMKKKAWTLEVVGPPCARLKSSNCSNSFISCEVLNVTDKQLRTVSHNLDCRGH